jgi:cell division septum initiation protein DivIVA
MNAFLDIVSKDPCPTLEEIESLIGENERLKEVLNHFKKTVAR